MVKQFEGISYELWKRFSLNFLVSEKREKELAFRQLVDEFYVEIEIDFIFCKLNIFIEANKKCKKNFFLE